MGEFMHDYRASLHLHELVNCRWVEEVTQQLDTLQLQSPGRSVETTHKDMLVVSLSHSNNL